MAKTKNDPTRYQKRAVSAPKTQKVVGAVKKTGLFFTAPTTSEHYLDFRAVAAPKPKRASGN